MPHNIQIYHECILWCTESFRNMYIRRKHLLFLPLVAVILGSCLGSATSEYTPVIHFSSIQNQHGDALKVRDVDDANVLDTVQVGDTLRFNVLFDAVGNNLTAALFNWERDRAEMQFIVGQAVADALLPESDTLEGKFLLAAVKEYRMLAVPAIYIPHETGGSKLSVQVESDSRFSPNKVELIIPAARRKSGNDTAE